MLFATIFKILPDVRIAWRDVWVGAVATAVLFSAGKILIGLYLGRSSVGSAFGAAGSLVVVLVWIKSVPVSLDTVSTTMTAAMEIVHASQEADATTPSGSSSDSDTARRQWRDGNCSRRRELGQSPV